MQSDNIDGTIKNETKVAYVHMTVHRNKFLYNKTN